MKKIYTLILSVFIAGSFWAQCNSISAPYIQNFDATTLNPCWTQSTTDNLNWTLKLGSTGSSGTGPTSGNGGSGRYLYIETSNGNPAGHSATIFSPSIDLSALTNSQLRFYSHMYGATCGTLTVDVSTDNGTTYSQVFTKSGNQGNQWNEEIVSLAGYTGTAVFKITATKGSSFTGDIAFDDFELMEAPSCPQISGGGSSNITATSADLSWTSGGAESSWNFEYGADGYTRGTGTSSVINGPSTIAINPNSLFVGGNAVFPYVYPLALTGDGLSSQAAQTFTINVTSLPAGASVEWRLIKQNSGTGASFVPNSFGQPLVLGLNTLTAPASTWNRYVKAQFKNNAFEFDAITVNGISIYNGTPTNTLTGLTADTQYDFYVQASCSATDQSPWVGPYSFTTVCSSYTGPYSQNFDGTTAPAIDGCWNVITAPTPISSTYSISTYAYTFNNTYYFSSPNSIRMYNYNATTMLLASPEFSDFDNSKRISFKTKTNTLSTTHQSTLIVGTMSDPNDATTFTPFYTIPSATIKSMGWVDRTVDFSLYTGTDKYIGLKHDLADNFDVIYIDNFIYESIPSCLAPAPSSIAATNVTPSSADLSWTAGGTETAWEIEYGPSPLATPTASGTSVSATTSSLTGLSGLTDYDFYVRAICSASDQSTWSGPYSFTTAGPGDCSTSVNYSYSNNSTLASSLKGFVANTPGDYITLTFTSGSTESCCDDWVITDSANGNGNTIATGGGSILASNGGVFESTTGEISFHIISDASVTGTPFIFSASCAAPPACPNPTLLSASNLTSSSADISWNATGATSYNIEYGPNGYTQGTGGTASTASATNTSFTGLNSLTQYDVYVQSDCGSGAFSSWVGPLTISTLPTGPAGFTCTTTGTNSSLVFDDDFESNVTSWTGDANWEITGGNGASSTGTGPDNANIHSGSGIMNFEASNTLVTHTGSKYSPAIDLTAASDAAELSFWMHGFGANMGTFEVAVGDGPASTGTYTTVFTTTGQTHSSGASPWWNIGVDLTSYLGQTIYLKFTMIDDQGGYTGDMAIDLVEVSTCVSCSAPSLLTASNITSNSADISWTAGGTETAWNYEYGPVNFSQGSGTSSVLSSANTSLTGLTANTSYHAYVQADCGRGNTSGWVGPLLITTQCAIVSTFPFTEDFETTSTTASCWVNADASSNKIWTLLGGVAKFTASSGGPHTAKFVSPIFDMSSLTLGGQVSFDYKQLNWSGDQNELEVFYRISTTDSWVSIWSDASNVPVLTNITLDLPNISSTYQIAFQGTDNYGYANELDNIIVKEAPPCLDVTGVAASNITNNSADISWSSGPNAVTWDFEYGPANFSPGTGTLSTLTLGSISLTGLTANTSYDVYVQSNCGANGAGVNVGPFNFTTECDIVTTFPYTMDFENGFDCWDQLDVDGGNSWGLFSAVGIGNTVAAGILYNFSAHDDHLISPKFSVTANSTRFSFNASDYFGYPESFEVLVSTTGKSAADFTDTISSEVASGGYSYYQYDLSSYIGQDIYVSIHSTSTNQYYLFVDNVTIDEFISKTIIQSETSCDSYTWSVNGTSYISDTSLTVFSPAVDVTDADSTFILNLTINNSTSITETITACDSLSWNGNTYFASDSTATASLQTSSGCDSIVTLNLTINNSSLTSETVTACDTYDWQGNSYTTSGNYSYSDTTINGCDSTINLVLTVNYSSSSLTTTTACNSYTWKGTVFDTSGIQVAPASTNFAGCPQVDSLDLTITTIATSDTQTACDSYSWNGNTYTTSGTYYSSSACVDTLYLTVNASSSSSSTVAACDSSVWNGITYFTSGTYNVFTTNAAGCDSTATLNLTVGNSASNTVTVSECDSYNWNGNTYISSGVYPGVFQTSTGCDSTVNLVLTINSSSNQSVTVFSCDEYTWDGVSYTASGDYTNNYTSVSGCDSTVTLVLTVGTTAAPFTEGFDINFPNCWSQPDSTDGEDALDWTRNSFATLSQGTGPSDDVIGGGHYMYIESSSPAQHGDNAIMYSNFIDISSLTNPELRFFSHMYGESTGSLTVEIQGENDTVPTTIFSKSGDHGDLWIQERVTFASTSNRVKFKITGVLDSNSLGAVWAGDMAIDEFGVREAVPNDLAIIAAAVNSDCELTNVEEIELWVVNNGLVDQTDFKLSYSINGGAPVLDSISQLLNIGDTLKYIFGATADMSTDGIYDIDFECILAIDADATDNVLNFVAENYINPVDAVTLDDTICFIGDVGQISAISDGWIYWYDSLVGGSLVGENDTLYVTPSATTSYFAEVSVYSGFEEDFESYSPGDLIAQSSNDWNTWSNPNGGADDDAEVTDFVSSGGSNSLYLNDDNSDDIVLPLGNTYSSGTFNFETDMYIETEAYFNFQEDAINGEAWAFDLYFTETEIKVEIDDSTVLTVAYSPNNPLGAPVWFNFSLEADLDNGQWKMLKDGVSIGAFSMSDEISSVNFWASTGNNYYIDNVKWSAWGGDACRSLSRTEAVVVLDSCNTTSVSEVSFENLKIYPNPNNGSFTISNSEIINGVLITDLQGKVVYRNSNLNLYNLNVNLENLDRGMYMINIISENEIITKSIIVN